MIEPTSSGPAAVFPADGPPSSGPHPSGEILRQLVLEQIPAVFWSVDRRLHVTSSIGAGLRGLGLTPNQTVGLTLSELFQTRDPSSIIIVNHKRALAGEKVFHELDWKGRVMHARVEPLRGPDGSIIGAVGMALDITERKRAEAALQDSEERWKAVVSQAPDYIFILDPEGRVFYINHAFYRIPEEIIGKSILDFILPAHRAVIQNACRRASESGEIVKGDIQVRVDPNGPPRWLRGSVGPLHRGGRVSNLILLASDITEQKKADEALRASLTKLRKLTARLESVREEERRRIAMDIHDRLGQALTVVKLNVSSLAPTGKAGAEFRRSLRSVSRSLDEAIRAVREISTELRPPVLDALGLKATVDWQARDFAKKTGISCNILLPRGEISLGRDRSTAVFRIFQEILTNVARHAGARRVNVSLTDTGDRLTLTVADDGRGITRKALSDPSSLGLLGMRERALAFGGSVEIRKRKPRGTHVSVSIPTGGRSRKLRKGDTPA